MKFPQNEVFRSEIVIFLNTSNCLDGKKKEVKDQDLGYQESLEAKIITIAERSSIPNCG